jgi:ketosteroid isomerase-like protein
MRVIRVFLMATLILGCATVSTKKKCDEEVLREAIAMSAAAFNAGDPDAVISQYARDVILNYPGEPDLRYDVLKENYKQMLNRPPGVTASTVPTIEEIFVSGDLGVIRLMWTTTTVVADPPKTHTRQMKDLQVWRRDQDGTWKFARGMHYRMSPPM